MSTRTLRLVCAGVVVTAAFNGLLAGADKPAELKFATAEASRAEYERVVAPFFARHCITCHGPRKAEGELALDKLDPDMKASTSAARRWSRTPTASWSTSWSRTRTYSPNC